MKSLKQSVVRFVKDEAGTETLEWGLICGLVVIGAITAITVIGPKVTTLWNNVAAGVNKVP